MTESSSTPIRPNAGGGITPDQTVGRDELVADLLGWLTTESVRIVDPRRMGKTSVLKKLASFSTDQAPIVFVTVQGYDTADDIVLEIARSLYSELGRAERFKETLKGFFDSTELNTGIVKFQKALDTTDASGKLEQLLGVLSGKFSNGSLTIAIDELPWAVSNIANGTRPGVHGSAAAGVFMQALQRFRAKFPDIRWVLAGSIGFHHVLRLADSTNAVLSGLRPVSCGPLNENAIADLNRRLLAGMGLAASDDVVQALSDLSGGIPFIAHHLVELLGENEVVDAAAVERVFDDFVRDQERSNDLTHLLQRLDTYMAASEAAVAEQMLDACATVGPCSFEALGEIAGVDRDDALTIVDWLVNDHYLVETSNGFTWRYDVLRKVWTARRRL